MALTAKQKAAQTLLSDPEFDVESFIENINIHYKNPEIVRTLGTHTDIVLNLIKSGTYHFLMIHPEFINQKIFKEMHDRGYEVWHLKKERKNSYDSVWWHVIYDDIIIKYRILGNIRSCNFNLEVIPNCDDKEIKRQKRLWKNNKLTPYGEERKDPPVYALRKELWDCISKLRASHSYYDRNDLSRSEFRLYQYANGQSTNFYFQVLQAGPSQVRAIVKDIGFRKSYDGDGRPVTSFVNEVVCSKKFSLSEPDLAWKIISYAAANGKFNREYFSNSPDFKKILASEKIKCKIK